MNRLATIAARLVLLIVACGLMTWYGMPVWAVAVTAVALIIYGTLIHKDQQGEA